MIELSICGIFLCIISFIVNIIINNYNLTFIIPTSLALTYAFYSTIIKKSEIGFPLSLFILSYFSLYMILEDNKYPIINYIYILGFILTIIYGYTYIIHKRNNKMNLKFKNITIPKEKHLVCKYLTGLKFNKIGNALITKDNDNLYIEIESDNDKEIFKTKINKKDLVSITSKSKPYIISSNKLFLPGFDFTKSYYHQHGVVTEAEDTLETKEIKPIESFMITIELKNDNKIEFLSFDNPNNFFTN